MAAPRNRATIAKPPAASAVLEALQGEVPRRRFSLFYTLGLLIVAAAMILLPLVYLALIGLVGYGVYYHAAHDYVVLFGGGTHGGAYVMLGRLLAYAGPLVIGALLILFMIKPLFARPSEEEFPLTLDRSQEPLLFAFVERLCKLVHAPMPRRIDVDCRVNASASFRRGFISMFGSDLVLTIGLPLAPGLTVRQLAGVLAHEFGHFSQGLGLRLDYIICRINRWFFRVVYERDEWDDKLVDWARDTDVRIGIVFHLTRLFVWMTRRVLWVLMYIGHMISCFMSRQEEYDADWHEAQLMGADCFETTTRRFLVLAAAWNAAHSDLQLSWQERRLADNLPVFVVAKADQLPPDARSKLEEELLNRRAGLFATHPSAAARVRKVREAAPAGVFRCDEPATVLFGNFKMIANAVTLTYYRDGIGLNVQKENLVPTEKLVGDQEIIWREQRARKRYFLDSLTMACPVFPGVAAFPPPSNPKETVLKLKAARQRLAAGRAEAVRASDEIGVAEGKAASALLAGALLQTGVPVTAQALELPKADQPSAENALREALARRESLAASLDPFYKVMRFRLVAALRLASVPAVAARLENGPASLAHAVKVAAALARLESAVSRYRQLARSQPGLRVAVAILQKLSQAQGRFPRCRAVVRELAEAQQACLRDLYGALDAVEYPFEHGPAHDTVGRFALPQRPASFEYAAMVGAVDGMLERIKVFYFRSMAVLAILAEQVEEILGLPPLAEPAVKEEKQPAPGGSVPSPE